MTELCVAARVRGQMEYLKGKATKDVETNINQASAYIQTGDFDKPWVYSRTCMNLGSTIDSAIAMNAVPSSSHLPQLLRTVREVYRRKTELQLTSLMLLMLPIKAACQVGWFSDRDKDDVLMMAKEVCNGFSNTDKMTIEPTYAHSYVSNIISRFYPTMKVENILTSFDVKAGYGIFVVDFHISQGTLSRHCQNLWLLVARMDNMDTSACIASPSNVDFLINGSGVPRRIKSNMGKGPQLPSNLTKMSKYGVNLLQVLGDFEGQYIIVVAFMNLISSHDIPPLQDYVHPISDRDGIEMSSLISLDCPISKLRIRTPVKGHLCKHHQCFDYKYFMEVNSRWPTWKCPICNNPVCNLHIRIDRNFVKILSKVAEDVCDIVISGDGSWTVSTKTKSQTIETNKDSMTQNNSAISVTVSPPHPPPPPPSPPPPPPVSRDSRSQSLQTSSHVNVVNLTKPNHPSAQHGQTNRTTQPNVGTSTTNVAQSTTSFIAPNVKPPPPPRSEDGLMPSGRMRGSLKGDELAAARLRLLAPPRQPVWANEPWSRPPKTLPIELLMQQTSTNSHNTLNPSK